MNPYWGADFFQFFLILTKRIGVWLGGGLPLAELAPDEVQLIAFIFLGLSSAITGSFLVLRKMTMLANSLSHTILVGIAIAYLILRPFIQGGETTLSSNLHLLILAALITALVTTFLTELIVKVFRVSEDASIGLVFTSLFALGIVIVTLYTRNAHIGTEAIMGNIDALQVSDLRLLNWIVGINLATLLLFGKRLKIVAFDQAFASTVGISVPFIHYIIVVLAALTSVGGFRAVGVVMILALFTAPILTARLFCHRLRWLILFSALISIGSALISVALARHLLSVYEMALSTSGLYVAMLTALFFFSALYKIFTRACRQFITP